MRAVQEATADGTAPEGAAEATGTTAAAELDSVRFHSMVRRQRIRTRTAQRHALNVTECNFGM